MTAADLVGRAIHSAAARLPDLFAPNTRLLVAFSGGQDSTALLHALRSRPGPIAAHVDHGLRPDSAVAAAAVTALADDLGVPIEVRRVDVRTYRETTRQSVQQAARSARYQVLAALSRELKAAAVVVGHTADDQAETLLLNLLRGAGLAGLAGMRISEDLDVARLGPPLDGVAAPPRVQLARPLLRVARRTTREYCAEAGLRYVEDLSNESRAYTRNRIRLDLLPALEAFNPAVREVLARTADLAAEDLAALDAVVEELHSRLAQAQDGRLIYKLDGWRRQPRALQRRLLRRGLRILLGRLLDVPSAPIEDALDLVASARPGAAYHLPHGVELRVQEGDLLLTLITGEREGPSV